MVIGINRHGAPHVALVLAGVLACAGAAAQAPSAPGGWGTYLKPFLADSPWNMRPVDPVLGDFEIPKSSYFPVVAAGPYSTGAFLAKADDPPMEILPLPGKPGIWDPDSETVRPSITIPHWPADVIPASGTDGHADVVDPTTGVIHSFWVMKQVDGKWRAAQYAWSRIDGRGWGDPAHYFQGARAAAVPTMGGIIRVHEVTDGQPFYAHALAMSLTFNALSPNPAYIFPATSADVDAARTNSGKIPEGALVMLPPDFDVASIGSAALRKVAETLKRYGAYVVDRNVGTPFAIYVENGSRYDLHNGHWNGGVANDLDRIRGALRQVVKTRGWVDGNGHSATPDRRLNILSMRGKWTLQKGSQAGTFDSWRQAVVFGPDAGDAVQLNSDNRMLQPVAWAIPQPDEAYRFTVHATGGARLRLQISGAGGADAAVDTGELADGKSALVKWPGAGARVVVTAIGGGAGHESAAGATLVPVKPPVAAD